MIDINAIANNTILIIYIYVAIIITLYIYILLTYIYIYISFINSVCNIDTIGVVLCGSILIGGVVLLYCSYCIIAIFYYKNGKELDGK